MSEWSAERAIVLARLHTMLHECDRVGKSRPLGGPISASDVVDSLGEGITALIGDMMSGEIMNTKPKAATNDA